MKKNQCKNCNITFSESYKSCPRCNGTKLSVVTFSEAEKPSTGTRVDILESRRDLAHLNESQKKEMIALEADFALYQKQHEMVEAYKAMGLTAKEACIAAGMEKRIVTKIDEKFSF